MEERFNINFDDPTPIYAQLERAIRFAIATDRLRVGEQLPTVRQLAVDLKINANTVAKVYAELERTEILETRRGIGTFVRGAQTAAAMNVMRGDRERELRAFGDVLRDQVYFLARCGFDALSLRPDQSPEAALQALGEGEPLALAGGLTPRVWTDKQGNTRPALDMVAHRVLTAHDGADRHLA